MFLARLVVQQLVIQISDIKYLLGKCWEKCSSTQWWYRLTSSVASVHKSFRPRWEDSRIFGKFEHLLLRFQEVQQNGQKTSCLCTLDSTFLQLPTFTMKISWVNNNINAAICKHQSTNALPCDWAYRGLQCSRGGTSTFVFFPGWIHLSLPSKLLTD